jgi:2-amino-4-hydroxy-6-hydroxymethyldihydropteridine diphosphokinase
MGELALIGLGSNLGDRKATLDTAVAALAGTPDCLVRAVSTDHETAPVGGPDGQGAFLNAAAAIETALEPMALLRALQEIEQRAGRVRTVRWGERTLDLDILLFGDRKIRTIPVVNRVHGGPAIELQVPHPRMALRRFVLAPLAEIAPDAIDPVTRRTVADLLANLDRRPSLVTLHDPEWDQEVTPLADGLMAGLVARLQADPFPYRRHRETYRRRLRSRRFRAEYSHEPGKPSAELIRASGIVFESCFEALCRDMSQACSPIQTQIKSWLVSDFWVDAVFPLATFLHDDPGRFLERLLKAHAEVMAPTFVVVPAGWSYVWPAPLGDAPILEVDPAQPADVLIGEVLSACQSTRPSY